MKSLLEFVLLRLIKFPEDLKIDEIEEFGHHKYLIKLNEEDYGRVIGKGGKVIRAIRKLAQTRAIKDQVRVRVDLLEDNN
jgi:predicted RNA-binding protein YlqC (UPF0109 family)